MFFSISSISLFVSSFIPLFNKTLVDVLSETMSLKEEMLTKKLSPSTTCSTILSFILVQLVDNEIAKKIKQAVIINELKTRTTD